MDGRDEMSANAGGSEVSCIHGITITQEANSRCDGTRLIEEMYRNWVHAIVDSNLVRQWRSLGEGSQRCGSREAENVSKNGAKGVDPWSLLTYGVDRGSQDMHIARKKSPERSDSLMDGYIRSSQTWVTAQNGTPVVRAGYMGTCALSRYTIVAIGTPFALSLLPFPTPGRVAFSVTAEVA